MRVFSRLVAPPALLLLLLAVIVQWTADGAGARSGPAQASAAGAVPPAGGVTTTIADTSDVSSLLETIPFDVRSLFIFNVTSQYWMSFTPGGADWLNQSFTEHLAPGAVVWVRRSISDDRGGIDWKPPVKLAEVQSAQELPVPPAGRVTAGPAGTTSVETLIRAQNFAVRTVFALDVAQQRYVAYSPGAPAWANTLDINGLKTSSIVWVSRQVGDGGLPVTTGSDSLAAVGRVTMPTPTDRVEDRTVAAPRADRGSSSGGSGWTPPPPKWETAPPVGEAPTGGTSNPPSVAPSQPAGEAPSQPAAEKPTPEPTKAPSQPPAQAPSGGSSGGPSMVSGADMFRHLTYESGEQAMTSDQAPPGGLGRTNEAARAGSSAGFALLQPGDPSSNAGGYRAEWHGDDHASAGSERWHGISYFFPGDYDQGSNSKTWNDRIIFQFTDEGSPIFSLHLDAAREQLWVRRKLPQRDSDGSPNFETLARFDFDPGRWYDVVFHAKWTKDNSGFFEVFVNGSQVVDYSGRTLVERDQTYSKWGIYGQPTHVLFDEVWAAEGPGQLR